MRPEVNLAKRLSKLFCLRLSLGTRNYNINHFALMLIPTTHGTQVDFFILQEFSLETNMMTYFYSCVLPIAVHVYTISSFNRCQDKSLKSHHMIWWYRDCDNYYTGKVGWEGRGCLYALCISELDIRVYCHVQLYVPGSLNKLQPSSPRIIL